MEFLNQWNAWRPGNPPFILEGDRPSLSSVRSIRSTVLVSWRITYAAARSRLASELASIELLPYHSAAFHDADGWLKNLPSVALARDFVSSVVLPKVRSKKAIVIVTRKAQEWNVPAEEGTIIYTAGEARAAHLTPSSRGGTAIIDFLLTGGGAQ